jgi:F-type H+-transporting ATPase subunit delta
MAESFELDLQLADVYAEALFELARQAGQVPQVRGELEELARLETTEPDFASFMRSEAIAAEQRQASLERMFRGRLSDVVLNTFLVMNQHGRAFLVPALHRAFVVRQEHSAGQVEVRVTSAVELDAAQRAHVERWAAEVSGRAPLITYTVDPRIVGGLIVQIGDQRYDHSVRRHLHVARARFLERSNRGLNIGAG